MKVNLFILGNISQQSLFLIHWSYVSHQAINASNGIHPKVQGAYSGSSIVESTSNGAVVVGSKVDVQHVNSNSKEGGNKTLDRINL